MLASARTTPNSGLACVIRRHPALNLMVICEPWGLGLSRSGPWPPASRRAFGASLRSRGPKAEWLPWDQCHGGSARGGPGFDALRREGVGALPLLTVSAGWARPRRGAAADRNYFAALKRATASAPAGRRMGQAGSVAARQTASETSREVVMSPPAWRRPIIWAASAW